MCERRIEQAIDGETLYDSYLPCGEEQPHPRTATAARLQSA